MKDRIRITIVAVDSAYQLLYSSKYVMK